MADLPDPADLHAYLHTVPKPFNSMDERELIPGAEALQRFNASLR